MPPHTCNFIKKNTLAQVFSCEFCEISNNTFFDRTPLVAASENIAFLLKVMLKCLHDSFWNVSKMTEEKNFAEAEAEEYSRSPNIGPSLS